MYFFIRLFCVRYCASVNFCNFVCNYVALIRRVFFFFFYLFLFYFLLRRRRVGNDREDICQRTSSRVLPSILINFRPIKKSPRRNKSEGAEKSTEQSVFCEPGAGTCLDRTYRHLYFSTYRFYYLKISIASEFVEFLRFYLRPSNKLYVYGSS